MSRLGLLAAACALAVLAAPARAQEANPHAGHDMGQLPTSPEGMDHGQMQHGAHAGHQMMPAPMSPAEASQPPLAPPPPEAFTGPENAADTVWNPKLMARVRKTELIDMHGRFRGSKLMVDRLEYRGQDGRDGYLWDAEGWIGGDYDKLWIKTEGEGAFEEALESAEVQALWSHAISPWFDVQAGVRYDIRPRPKGSDAGRAHAVLGLQGLAPYWLEVDAALFLSGKGDLTARIEAEHDMRLTNSLILQPRAEVDLAAQNVAETGTGSGLSSFEAGLRLRYEFIPEFAPYIGIEYARLFGNTRDYARAEGEDTGGWSFLVGVRTWF